MRDLYIDFDGVIRDTIKVSYRMMEDLGIKLSDREKVIKFYQEIDWNYLLNISEEIKAKLNDIRKNCKEVSVISSPSGISKAFLVNPKNSINSLEAFTKKELFKKLILRRN